MLRASRGFARPGEVLFQPFPERRLKDIGEEELVARQVTVETQTTKRSTDMHFSEGDNPWGGGWGRAGLKDWVLRSTLITLITWFGGPTPAAAQEPGRPQHSTVQDFLSVPLRPVAIGHHGVGPYTPATNPGLPIENTVDSVRQAYTLGARVVEVDVQLTADGKLAVFHDDFLSDFTCIHSLTLDQLQVRLPYVPELRQIINVAREFNNRAGADLGGILIVELKAFSPHCDPGDDFEQPLVASAVNEIRQEQFADRVMFDSFSPALLYLAQQMAPEIPRELDLDGVQLLTPAQVQIVTGMPVTVINKKISLGLTWAEIGPVFRLPGYASPVQFLITGLVTQVRVVGGEKDFFGAAEQQQPGSSEEFVAAAHSLGMRAFADPASTPGDWNFFASLGVDAIYSTIPMGVQLQPVIPEI
jgi:glycerophosphoryl diester phosphodiesterase